MKRARETNGMEDAAGSGPEPTLPWTTSRAEEAATGTVTQAEPPNHHSTNSNATAALLEIRAKLEQARRKKIAAEERLWRQKQQTSALPNATAAPTNATVPATAAATTDSTTTTSPMTKAETNETIPTTRQGILTNPRSSSNITRAQEAQEALDRARSRLQGALQNRERALQQQQQQQQQQRMNNSKGPLDPAATPGSSSSTSWNRKRRHSQQTHFSLQPPGRYASHGNNNNNISLPPISALSPSWSLRISEISQTGPPDMVFHYKERKNSPFSSMGHLGSRRLLEAALGGKKAVRALHQDSSDASWDGGETTKETGHGSSDNDSSDNAPSQEGTKRNTKKRTAGTTASATKKTKKKQPNVTSTSLLQRKIQLQNELMALKEKLEMKSSQEPKHKPPQPAKQEAATPRNKKIATKEGLERRKAEAQTIMDISYWKHFVSKQEHLLEQVTTKINNLDHGNSNSNSNSNHHRNNPTTLAPSRGGAPNNNNNTYQECLQKRHSTNKAIAKVQFDLDTLEQRQEVVEEGIVASTQQLLEARQVLYEERAKQSKETTTKGSPI